MVLYNTINCCHAKPSPLKLCSKKGLEHPDACLMVHTFSVIFYYKAGITPWFKIGMLSCEVLIHLLVSCNYHDITFLFYGLDGIGHHGREEHLHLGEISLNMINIP